MNIEGHLEHLKAKHAKLENQIDEENQRPMPDSIRITELKREKLRVKEEITRLEEG